MPTVGGVKGFKSVLFSMYDSVVLNSFAIGTELKSSLVS